MTVREAYPEGDCPDCGEPIPATVVDGAACSNCGHVFYAGDPAPRPPRLRRSKGADVPSRGHLGPYDPPPTE